MGFKASLIIIQQPFLTISEEELLQKLGFTGFAFSGETTLEECMYPRDNSISFAHYNNCLVISDDYQLTEALDLNKTPQLPALYETVLSELYPGSEILTVSCHSVVNYHMYSLVKDGQKLRYKRVVSGEPVIEYGKRMKEEEELYANSKLVRGELLFKSDDADDEYEYTEDQLMEAFTFGIAKRHLGVTISTGDEDEIMFDTPFRKYIITKKEKPKQQQSLIIEKPKSKGNWFSRLFK